ncbi:dolichol-phosphate mannosyltransferase [Candidatus Nitrosoglobus terrae]|uniref:Dolichol-phosphate mannosyltransferase n=1 Tax=Candidatus Nitrosoglobus terrae TaxID=1630141 RepID=A0A1Q2SPN4_9GAMM|nr:glycosyltransferase family 2 protein [Candidatus Nitrosoglobus terrae]BAW81100.1 dolichol-phosphate mannosyltransferase [Candidatus Nitrosoglobus terrae]
MQRSNENDITEDPLELSIIIPFFNERDNVEPLLAEIDSALCTLFTYEIIAVDDGSTDGTTEILSQRAAYTAHLRMLRLEENRGQSVAIANGVYIAKAPLIVTLDGDGQNPPANIPTLVSAYHAADTYPCIIAGWRQNRYDSLVYRLSSRLANTLRCCLLHDKCRDTGCGLKVFARQTFLMLPLFNHMHRFLPALVNRMGGKVINVPVTHRYRKAGRSKYGVRNRLLVGLVDLAGVYWLMRRSCPILHNHKV